MAKTPSSSDDDFIIADPFFPNDCELKRINVGYPKVSESQLHIDNNTCIKL